ncbi:MAG: hypothetical protein Ct9H90mP4_11190 [Gammaproteobacteria bacterium]|nr:MAG: hypothetical protein Ct9H90mP4_11190 [Gammaproteobacteria bacterium]
MCEVFMARGIDIVSNGTENHMFLVDLIKNKLRERMQMKHLERLI